MQDNVIDDVTGDVTVQHDPVQHNPMQHDPTSEEFNLIEVWLRMIIGFVIFIWLLLIRIGYYMFDYPSYIYRTYISLSSSLRK